MTRWPAAIAAGWAAMRRRSGDSSEFDLLARTFFARFFDNDITGGSADLRTSFFWLLALLAAPGVFMPILMTFNWDGIALGNGTEALRVLSRGDKVFYLGYSMIAAGLVSAITWSSLLLDRRDCLVLGALPVPGPRIVRAKLTALCAYVLTVAIVTHGFASLAWGFCLGTHGTIAFAWAGTVAHMIASCGISAFVLLAVAAGQGLVLATLGPRRFSVISPWLQSAVVAAVLLGLVLLPLVTASTVGTLGGPTGHVRQTVARAVAAAPVRPWILRTPPLWFLGIYEGVLQTDDPNLRRLAVVALTALSAAGLVTLVTYPLAYRRLVASVVEMPEAPTRRGWTWRLIGQTVIWACRDPVRRASSQFFLSAIQRSARHRLTVAMAAGVTVAVVGPSLFRWAPRFATLPDQPPIDLLAVPLVTIAILLVGFRLAAALPADLNAGWTVDSIGASRDVLRSGAWRTMFVAVVVPVSFLVAPLYWRAWGSERAALHVVLCILVGVALIETLLWGFEDMPCTRPWRPERANLRTWWPAYMLGFLLITAGLPAIERMCFEEHTGFTALACIIAGTALTLRITHLRRRIIPDDDLDEPTHVQVLNLD